MFSIGSYLSQIKTQGDHQHDSNTPTATTSVIVAPTPEKVSTSKDYTDLIRNNETKERVIHASLSETKPIRSQSNTVSLPKPTAQEIAECTAKTKEVIDAILQERTSSNVTHKGNNVNKSEYIRYTSSDVLTGESKSSRLIKIVDAQQDPMAPPKFKQKKTMERPPSPPAPLLHDPTVSVPSKEEQQKWYIPPAISNWKNPNGFTIALDKRVAVDGRDPTNPGDVDDNAISDNFLNLAEALEDADKKAREEIKLRNAMKKRLAEKENKEKEEKLRQLAQRAREERSSYRRINDGSVHSKDDNDPEARKRAMIREERRQKAEKELRMSRMGNERRLKTQAKTLLDRDISERTQLGLAKATQSAENQFDSRLFINSTQIQNSEDQVYDNPLFVAQGINSIYKVSTQDYGNDEMKNMESEKRFDELNSGPVEFEKEASTHKLNDQSDDYGLQSKKQKTK